MIYGEPLQEFLQWLYCVYKQNSLVVRVRQRGIFYMGRLRCLSSCLISFYILTQLISCASPAYSRNKIFLSEKTLHQAELQFGKRARRDLLLWVNLVNNDSSRTDLEKLNKVNTFFNKFLFVSDMEHWQKEDYWATLVEFIASNGGDCEDFAIAKYFTLRELGIADSKLNVTYVKALKPVAAHMVVTYYSYPGAEPLVLDNLIERILPAGQRRDLIPVYSFNGSGLWLATQRGQGKKVGSSYSRMKSWRDLLNRMPPELKRKR